MDDWQDQIAQSLVGTIDRALSAAVDVAIMKETGIKQGPTFSGNTQQSTAVLQPGAFGVMAGGGLPQWVPVALMLAAGALIVWKLAK